MGKNKRKGNKQEESEAIVEESVPTTGSENVAAGHQSTNQGTSKQEDTEKFSETSTLEKNLESEKKCFF
jgi:hypothetical protein